MTIPVKLTLLAVPSNTELCARRILGSHFWSSNGEDLLALWLLANVWTPLIPSTMPAEKVKTFGSNTGFGRPAWPIELAKIFVVLAFDDASYVTGEVYGATGGRTP
jgi:hypothetical protein